MKPKTKKQPKKPEPVNDEPGVKYWFVFGQVHFVKAATATSAPKRKQVRLGEYMKTETLDPLGEIKTYLKNRFSGSPGFDLIEVYGMKELAKRKWMEKQKPRKPENILAVIKLEQLELFPAAALASAAPQTLCKMPAVSGQPETTTPTAGANAQESGDREPGYRDQSGLGHQ